MNDQDVEQLELEDQERLAKLRRVIHDEPHPAVLPEQMCLLDRAGQARPTYEVFGAEYMRTGVSLGRGWKLIEDQTPFEQVARARALEQTLEHSRYTRVVGAWQEHGSRSDSWKAEVLCYYYMRDDKLFVAVQAPGSGSGLAPSFLEQQLLNAFDHLGEDIVHTSVEELKNLLGEEGLLPSKAQGSSFPKETS